VITSDNDDEDDDGDDNDDVSSFIVVVAVVDGRNWSWLYSAGEIEAGGIRSGSSDGSANGNR